jgi:transcriptional antiterminator RfaH
MNSLEDRSEQCVADPRWYVVQARNKQEERAATNLVSLGLTTFLPVIRAPRRRGSSWTLATMPLFPRYLFVRCDLANSAHHIRYTRGVTKLLGTSEGPVPIDDVVVESILRRTGEDGFVRLTDTLEAGDPVEITSGPFCGFVGVFHSNTCAATRVVILLSTVHSQTRVTVDSAVIRKLSA